MTPAGRRDRLLDDIASGKAAPASGSAAAAVVAAAAALLEKVARLSTRRWTGAPAALERAHALRLHAEELIELDKFAYFEFLSAVRLGRGLDEARAKTIDVPLETARTAKHVVDLAHGLALKGNPNLRADAVAAAIFAESAVTCVEMLIQVNLGIAVRDRRLTEVRRLLRAANGTVRRLSALNLAGDRDRVQARSPDTGRRSPRRTSRGDRRAPIPRR